MTYRGLLTAEEARKCVEAGYEGDWLEYSPGSIDTVGPIEPFGNCGPVDGYAPLPGHFLPMATAPRDGRDVLVMTPHKELLVTSFEEYHGRAIWAHADGDNYEFDDQLLGWSPIITPE